MGFAVVAASCGDEETKDICEYGVPHVNFSLKGKVTDSETGSAIEGIQVKLTIPNEQDNHFEGNNIVLSGGDGSYDISLLYLWPQAYSFEVEASDIDGEDNGGYFAPAVYVVEVAKDDFQNGSGSWYEGLAEKELNISLDKGPSLDE